MVIHTLAFPDNCKFQKVVESIGDRRIGIGPETLIYRIWNNKAVPRTNCSIWNQSLPKSTTRFDAESSLPLVSSFGKYLNGRVIAFFFSPSFIYSRRIKIEWPLNGSKFQEWKTSFWLKNRACDDISKKKFAPFLTFAVSLIDLLTFQEARIDFLLRFISDKSRTKFRISNIWTRIWKYNRFEEERKSWGYNFH